MGDKSLAALTLWECLDGRQRGRLATQLKLHKNDPLSPSPTPAADIKKRRGVPGYVDVGISQASAEATLAVEWKIGADAWKQAHDEGATLYVSLHSHHPGDENEKNAPTDHDKHDICRLPIDSAQGTAQFPAAKLNLGGSLRAGLAARILKVTKTKKKAAVKVETGEGHAVETPAAAGDADLPSDDDVAVLAKSEVVNIVTGTLERTWSMQVEKVSVMLNTSAIPLTPPKAAVTVAQPGTLCATRREDAVATMQDEYYEGMTSEEREAAFASMWAALPAAEQAKLRPHLTASNRGREIVKPTNKKSTSKAAAEGLAQKKNKKAKTKKTKKVTKKSVIKKQKKEKKVMTTSGVTTVMTEEKTTTPIREKPAQRSANARTAVLIPSTVEPQLEAAAAAQRADDDAAAADVDVEDWVVLAPEIGEPAVNEDTTSTVSLSFVEVSSSIQPSVVWNLTATEYYDWIGVVDAETDDTVAKVSINTLVSWTNPVGAHSWSEVMTTVAKKKGLSKKYYAVMWRWHEEANQYHALGYSSNIIRSVVSMERRELVRQNVSATEHMSAVYKDESLECAQLAVAAYKCYDALTCALPPPLEPVYNIENAKTDTQGFVSLDKTRGIAYVAFKGSWELADFMNDADLFLGPFVDTPQLKAQFKMVECWKSVKDPLLDLLLKYLKDKTISKITITGHSLGAALACLMTESILHDTRFDPYKLNSASLKLFTFACPRSFDWAANADSVKQLDKDRATMLSFVDQNDPVATGAWGFLKYFGYYHVGSVVLLQGSGHAMSNYINLIKALTP